MGTDQQRYIFLEFNYDNQLLKNIYREQDENKVLAFKIEMFTNNTAGNIFIVKKELYPEALYDYVTLNLDNEFYNFYLENKYNPKYKDIDLRAVWYFVALDRNVGFYIKKVRDTKYIFSYKRLCEAYDYPNRERRDVKVCCKNMGVMKKKSVVNDNKLVYLCPKHFSSIR